MSSFVRRIQRTVKRKKHYLRRGATLGVHREVKKVVRPPRGSKRRTKTSSFNSLRVQKENLS